MSRAALAFFPRSLLSLLSHLTRPFTVVSVSRAPLCVRVCPFSYLPGLRSCWFAPTSRGPFVKTALRGSDAVAGALDSVVSPIFLLSCLSTQVLVLHFL